MLNSFKLIFLLTLLTLEVNASIGEFLSFAEVPEQTCLITIENIRGERFHCSGSLIAQDKVKTAAHCLYRSVVKTVRCGLYHDAKVLSHEASRNFNFKTVGHEINNRKNDLAILVLDRKLPINPIPVITNEKIFKKLIQEKSKCGLFGFGLNDIHSKKTGYLNATRVRAEFLSFTDEILFLNSPFLAQLLPGDSGGALFCMYEGKWHDIGVSSGHTWGGESIFASNFYNKVLIDKYINVNRDEDIQAQSVLFIKLKQGIALDECIDKHGDDYWFSDLQSCEKSLSIKENNYYEGAVFKIKPFSLFTIGDKTVFNGDLKDVELTITRIFDTKVEGRVQLNGASSFYLCLGEFLCSTDVVIKIDKSFLREYNFTRKYYYTQK